MYTSELKRLELARTLDLRKASFYRLVELSSYDRTRFGKNGHRGFLTIEECELAADYFKERDVEAEEFLKRHGFL